MGWLKRLFGRKETGRNDDGGTDGLFMETEIVDLRPDWERRMTIEVQSDLNDEDEQYARELCTILRRHDRDGARRIGNHLYANGGHRRMVRVCLRVKALGGEADILERSFWNGVGEWMG